MKPQELRIGNYVQDAQSRDETIYKVCCLKTDDYVEWEWDGDGHFNVVAETKTIASEKTAYFKLIPQPIPLTEEWLFKLGFERKGVFIKHISYEILAVGTDGSFGLYNSKFDFDRGSSFSNNFRIKYVHQLQNLVFALTGEELTYDN